MKPMASVRNSSTVPLIQLASRGYLYEANRNVRNMCSPTIRIMAEAPK